MDTLLTIWGYGIPIALLVFLLFAVNDHIECPKQFKTDRRTFLYALLGAVAWPLVTFLLALLFLVPESEEDEKNCEWARKDVHYDPV